MKVELQISTYRDYLYNLLKKQNPYARNEDIEDCVQNSLVKAIRHCKQFKEQCSLRTWLTIITLRMYSESFRKRYVMNEYLLSSSEDEYIFENIKDNDFSISLFDEENYQEFIQELFSGFENNDVIEAFKLNVIDEIGYNEIAQKQNIPLGTVKSRIFRAKNILRDKYLLIHNKYESMV